jgi:hypothetical protein
MPNLYEAMIGGMTPEQDPRALANAVRSERARNALAQLSGDPVLSKFGSGRDLQVHDTAKTLGRDKGERDKTASQVEQKGLDRALTKTYYDQLGRQHEDNVKLRKSRLGLDRARMVQEDAWRKAQQENWAADRKNSAGS